MQGYPEQKVHIGAQIKDLSKMVNDQEKILPAIDANKDAAARNRYIYNYVSLCDLEYDVFLKRLTGVKNGVDGVSQIAVGAMGATGALVGGGTGQILNAAVAATTAASVAVDKTYFYNTTMPAIVSAMNAERQTVYVDISKGLSETYDQYPIAVAIRDLERYYLAGTFVNAQSVIQKESGAKSQTATDALKNQGKDKGGS
jgi:hypothetical protein